MRNGAVALYNDTIGQENTAIGAEALYENTTGVRNTAVGAWRLLGNTSGTYNTGTGYQALQFNTVGSYNTASGAFALHQNTNGYTALYANTTGIANTATGDAALSSNTTGSNNTASRYQALLNSTTANYNAAFGTDALYHDTTGQNNVAVGYAAMQTNAGESGVIRLGTSGTNAATYVAGINTAHVTGSAVYVTSTGQLGVLASSERYKTAIAPMGESSAKLERLRPVTFHLKSEPQGALQYGLIAEEVSRVYPDLVIRDGAGTIQGVRYDELAPLLLSQVQRQQQQMRQMERELAELRQQNAATQAALRKLGVAGMPRE